MDCSRPCPGGISTEASTRRLESGHRPTSTSTRARARARARGWAARDYRPSVPENSHEERRHCMRREATVGVGMGATATAVNGRRHSMAMRPRPPNRGVGVMEQAVVRRGEPIGGSHCTGTAPRRVMKATCPNGTIVDRGPSAAISRDWGDCVMRGRQHVLKENGVVGRWRGGIDKMRARSGLVFRFGGERGGLWGGIIASLCYETTV